MNYSNEIAALEVQIKDVKRERAVVTLNKNLAVGELIESYFTPFKEATIRVSGETATFYGVDEDGREKEIFNLYFYSRYQMDPELKLSYYSSSSQSIFELDRLILLGKMARIVKERGETIIKEILEVSKGYSNRLSELFGIEDKYQKEISAYNRENLNSKKVEIRKALLSKGITFSSSREIQLKFNQVPYMKELRIENISASGKTGRVVYLDNWGYSRIEEKVNVEKVVDQVTSLHTFIAELEIA